MYREEVNRFHFGKFVRAVRQGLGFTQEQFGDALDVSRTHIAYYETGKYMPKDTVAFLNKVETLIRRKCGRKL